VSTRYAATPKMVRDDVDTLVMDAQVLEEILGSADPAKKGKELEIKLIARLRRHLGNPKFTALDARLEKIKDRHEHGFLSSLEFLKEVLDWRRRSSKRKGR
jgi:type I restriction enzyme, R subunit